MCCQEELLIHWNIANNNYQQYSRVLYISVPNKSFDPLLNMSPKILRFKKTFNFEFSYTEVWFAHQK